MKLAIINRSDSTVKDWTDLTHPLFKKYADKCKADFIVLNEGTEPKGFEDNKPWIWRILKSHDLLKSYDRILHLDTDILINKNCPNLFETVPVEKIGVVYEDKGSRQMERRKRIKQIQDSLGNVGWKSGYLNEGVMMFSKEHKALFEKANGKYWNGKNGPSQGHFGWQIHKNNYQVLDLGFKYNHMSMFSERWNKLSSRFDSHIIHYAGGAKFNDRGRRSALELAKADFHKIWK
jgi:lipopolysaccharide biosynthesis glycosyltransferase